MVSSVCHIQEGRYAWVHEGSDELNLVSGAPPSFLHCSRQGELPGCLFMFDQVDQQCAEGRTGECTSSHISLSLFLTCTMHAHQNWQQWLARAKGVLGAARMSYKNTAQFNQSINHNRLIELCRVFVGTVKKHKSRNREKGWESCRISSIIIQFRSKVKSISRSSSFCTKCHESARCTSWWCLSPWHTVSWRKKRKTLSLSLTHTHTVCVVCVCVFVCVQLQVYIANNVDHSFEIYKQLFVSLFNL